MKEENCKRLSNFELLRIVSMFFIVFWHVFHHTLAPHNASYTLKYIVDFIYIFIDIHVNSFILVTGYFQYNKKSKYKKVLKLIGQVWFYNILFAILATYLGITMKKLELIEQSSILNLNNYWFINYYIVLYLISPLLNKFIEHSTQKEHKNMLIVMFVCFSIIPYITSGRTISNNGLNLINFIFLYLIGAYFGKYPIKESLYFKNKSKNKRQVIFLSLFIIFGLLDFIVFECGLNFLSSENPLINSIGTTIKNGINFANPILICQSIFYFLYFETLEIKSNFINKLSGLTFGIYLFHENSVLSRFIYPKVFQEITASTTVMIVPKMFIFAVCLFVISAFVEFLRKTVTQFLCKTKIVNNFTNKFYKYIDEF